MKYETLQKSDVHMSSQLSWLEIAFPGIGESPKLKEKEEK